MVIKIRLTHLRDLIDEALFADKHNVIVIWGELGTGKTTLGLQLLFKIALLIGGSKELCATCSQIAALKVSLEPGDVCEECERRVWEWVLQHIVFTFREFRAFVRQAVKKRIREPAALWDDLAVYFGRVSIMYMHPDVKDFFSTYNFVRPYLANNIITVPNIDFIPRQLLSFVTADLLVTKRGEADFDRAKIVRRFGKDQKSWMKNYDGFDVAWDPVPNDIYERYVEMRHQHAEEALEHPERVFVSTMPGIKKEEGYTGPT